MIAPKCPHCLLPWRLHYAHCASSGIKGDMPERTLQPASIVTDPREMPWTRLVPPEKRRKSAT